MKVVKIGGSLLRTPGDFLKAAQFVAGMGDVIVVVSAVKGVTDMLIELERTRSYLLLEEIYHRHLSIARALSVENSVVPLLKELESSLSARGPWVRDHFASFGERLSATMLHAVLRKMSIDAGLYIAPIVTDNTYGSARPLRLEGRDEMTRGGVAVVTGFIGRDGEGRFTTLGRGGSDYTATYIGREVGARKVTLVTDAPGVMTADPREVPEAYLLSMMSIYEAIEAANVGAKNFHPKTFTPALESGMAVEVRNYHSRGTLIAPIHPPPPFKIVTKCGRGSCVVGLAVEELTKLGAVTLSRYSAKLDIPPPQVHEYIVKPYFKKGTS